MSYLNSKYLRVLTTFGWKNNNTLEQEWEIGLPRSVKRDFYPYHQNGLMNVIFVNPVNDMTYIDVESGGKCHRLVSQSKFSHSWRKAGMYGSPDQDFPSSMRTVRVGDFLMFFGGSIDKMGIAHQVINFDVVNRRAFLWNTKRYKWYHSFTFPEGFGERMCGVGIDRSTAVFFGMKVPVNAYSDFTEDGVLKKITFNIWNNTGIKIDHQFHDFELDIYFVPKLDFDCATMTTKSKNL